MNKIGFQKNSGNSFAIFFGKKVQFWCSAWSHINDLKVKSVQVNLLPMMQVEYRPSTLNYDKYSSFRVMFGFLLWFVCFTFIIEKKQ